MGAVLRALRHLLTQDVARTNAAQASIRLLHRRQVEDADAYVAQRLQRRRTDAPEAPAKANPTPVIGRQRRRR